MNYGKSICQLESIQMLGPNWDSYEAQPLYQEVRERAWLVLKEVIKYELPEPWIAAGADNSIGFQWDLPQVELYIDVYENELGLNVTYAGEEGDISFKLEDTYKILSAVKQLIRLCNNLSEENAHNLRDTNEDQRHQVRQLIIRLFRIWPHRIQCVLPTNGSIGVWLKDLRGNIIDIICYTAGDAIISSKLDKRASGGYQATIESLPDSPMLDLIRDLGPQLHILREGRIAVAVDEEIYPPKKEDLETWAVRYANLGLTSYGQTEDAARKRLIGMFHESIEHHRNWGRLASWLNRMKADWKFIEDDGDTVSIITCETKSRPSLP